MSKIPLTGLLLVYEKFIQVYINNIYLKEGIVSLRDIIKDIDINHIRILRINALYNKGKPIIRV
ncbi:hypothetical protein SAMN02745136_05640, partial [Anaerocolumna jejuensis DSM 15929]